LLEKKKLSEGNDTSTREEARQKAQAVAMFLVSHAN